MKKVRKIRNAGTPIRLIPKTGSKNFCTARCMLFSYRSSLHSDRKCWIVRLDPMLFCCSVSENFDRKKQFNCFIYKEWNDLTEQY